MRGIPLTSDAEARVRRSFEKQAFMALLGARLSRVTSGEVDIELPFRADLVQQHGYLHAGVTTSIADSACGYAALTMMAPDAAVLSVEYKVNLMAPAAGKRFRASGRVIKAGKTLVIVQGQVDAYEGDDAPRTVLVLQGTMISSVGKGITD